MPEGMSGMMGMMTPEMMQMMRRMMGEGIMPGVVGGMRGDPMAEGMPGPGMPGPTIRGPHGCMGGHVLGAGALYGMPHSAPVESLATMIVAGRAGRAIHSALMLAKDAFTLLPGFHPHEDFRRLMGARTAGWYRSRSQIPEPGRG